jgi:hypothetical protein
MITKPENPQTSTEPLRAIRLDGIDLDQVEKMEVSALRDALRSVVRQEASTADHQSHASHSNSHGNSLMPD